MQLEIGKKYITKDPEICDYVEVIDLDIFFPYPLKVKVYGGRFDGYVQWYRSDGKFLDQKYSDFDLIAEYQENFDLEETQRQLENLLESLG